MKLELKKGKKVVKIGNSYGIIIPKQIIDELEIDLNKTYKITVESVDEPVFKASCSWFGKITKLS